MQADTGNAKDEEFREDKEVKYKKDQDAGSESETEPERLQYKVTRVRIAVCRSMYLARCL